MAERASDFIQWFRSASPYIHAHRGQTFVLSLHGEAIRDPGFAHLVHDIALLSSLGVRLVLVFGTRVQIETCLQERQVDIRYAEGLRITDDAALQCVKEAAGAVCVEIEALLSMGLPNSPMEGARIRVGSGNFVTAKPLGVRDGVDFCHTGEVRRVDAEAINARLANNEIVLVPPLGYSSTGEVFNLYADDLATAIAIALGASKLIFLLECGGVVDEAGRLIRQLTQSEAEKLLAKLKSRGEGAEENPIRQLECAIEACAQGVTRTHLIERHVAGALLLELFSRDGVGTMVSAAPFDQMRTATVDDVGGILELIEPLERDGVLVRRSREKLEMEIDHFTVLVRDGAIIGCAALYPDKDTHVAELACLTVHSDYQNQGRGEALYASLERDAKGAGASRVFVLTTRAAHWFLERGFNPAEINDLPLARKRLYNYTRQSKVFIKQLQR